MKFQFSNRGRRHLLLFALLGAALAGCASIDEPSKLGAVPESRPGILMGYLNSKELPNRLALLPPYPAKDSAALALDDEIRHRSFALRDTPRWVLAKSDADLAAARAELLVVRSKGLKPARDCAAEAAALATQASLAQ